MEGLIVVRISGVYETEPVGIKEQAAFLNAVLEGWSALHPIDLIGRLKEIEQKIGRTTSVRWGPREIDIDILYAGDLVVASPAVRVPHPEAPNRRFVLVPLAELAPGFPDPLTGRRLSDLLTACPGTEAVVPTTITLDA